MIHFRTFILVILVVLATLICLSVQVIVGINSTALNPHYYSNIMQKHNLYDLPQNYVLISIKNQSSDLLSEPVCKALTPSINTAFSDQWAKYQYDKIINSTIDYIKGNQEELQLQITLKDRKNVLHDEIVTYLETKYTADDLSNFQIDSSDKIASIIVESTNLPDAINLSEALNYSQNGLNKILDDLKHYYSFIAFVPYLLLLLLISGLIIFIGRSKGLKWLGLGVITASFITILLASSSNVIVDELIIDNITNQNEMLLTLGINPLILAKLIKNSIISNFNKIAIIFGLSGIILLLSGNYWSKIVKEKARNMKI